MIDACDCDWDTVKAMNVQAPNGTGVWEYVHQFDDVVVDTEKDNRPSE